MQAMIVRATAGADPLLSLSAYSRIFIIMVIVRQKAGQTSYLWNHETVTLNTIPLSYPFQLKFDVLSEGKLIKFVVGGNI